jgi:2-oxoglutarate dehydrogenase E1 component
MPALKQTYCGSIGAEYMHITNTEEKRWIQQRIGIGGGARLPLLDDEKQPLPERELTAAEGLERYFGALSSQGRNASRWKVATRWYRCSKRLVRHAGKNGTREAVSGHGAPRPSERADQRAGQKACRICSTSLPASIKNTSVHRRR